MDERVAEELQQLGFQFADRQLSDLLASDVWRLRLFEFLFCRLDHSLLNLDRVEEENVFPRQQRLINLLLTYGIADAAAAGAALKDTTTASFLTLKKWIRQLIEIVTDPVAVDGSEDAIVRDLRLLSSVCAEHQTVFATDCRLLPPAMEFAPVRHSPVSLDDVVELSARLEQLRTETAALRSLEYGAEEPYRRHARELEDQTRHLIEALARFTTVYENDMRPWTGKPPPRITELGAAADALAAAFAPLAQLMASMHDIRSTTDRFAGRFGAPPAADPDLGAEALTAFTSSIAVLEGALARNARRQLAS